MDVERTLGEEQAHVHRLLGQTIITVTNDMHYYKKSSLNNSIGRRVIIYRMAERMNKMFNIDFL